MNAKKFRLSEGWILTKDGYLVGLTTAEVYKLNETAKKVVESIQKGEYIENICKDLSSTYGIPYRKVWEDVFNFLKILQNKGVLEVE